MKGRKKENKERFAAVALSAKTDGAGSIGAKTRGAEKPLCGNTVRKRGTHLSYIYIYIYIYIYRLADMSTVHKTYMWRVA